MMKALLGMVLLAGPMLGPGQDGPQQGGRWWKDQHLVEDLGLQQAQLDQVERLFLDHRKATIDLRADIEKKELDLEELMASDSLEEGRISAQVDQVDAARSRLHKSEVMFTLNIRRILTAEQWKKFQTSRPPMQQNGPQHMRPPMPPRPPRSGAMEEGGRWLDDLVAPEAPTPPGRQRGPMPPRAPAAPEAPPEMPEL